MLSNQSNLFVDISEEQQEVAGGGSYYLELSKLNNSFKVIDKHSSTLATPYYAGTLNKSTTIDQKWNTLALIKYSFPGFNVY